MSVQRNRALYPITRLLVTFFLLSLNIITVSIAQVTSINLAKFDDQETITIFFDSPQTFPKKDLQTLFTVQKYNDDTDEYDLPANGQWHFSNDGYRLSYYPISEGIYKVSTDQFEHLTDHSVKSDTLYVGTPGKVVNIVGRGPVLPMQDATIPVELLGTREVDVQYYAINNLPQLLENFYIGSDITSWDLNNITHNTTPTGIFRYIAPIDTDINTKSTHKIPLDRHIPSGAYIVTAQPAGEIYPDISVRIVFISNIGLQARLYPESTVIIGNQFSDNAPINGATLEIWSDKKGKLQRSSTLCTFSEGLCKVPQRLKKSDVIVVKQNEDISILPLKEIALNLNDYAVTGEISTPDIVYLYANRTLFRPGETVTLNAILRDETGMMIQDQPLTLNLITPLNKVYATYSVDSVAIGFYQEAIKIPQDGQTGLWRVEARTDKSSEKPLGTLKLHIEEFMPERMELTLTQDGQMRLYNESKDIHIYSRYLFGAPAASNNVVINTRHLLDRRPFKTHNNWYVGPTRLPNTLFLSTENSYETVLDENGELTWISNIESEALSDSSIPAAIINLENDVNVLDGSIVAITRKTTTQFWPNKVVPVIAPQFEGSTIGYGEKAEFEIFSANQKGDIVPGKFLITLKYNDPYCSWIYSPSRGWNCYSNDGFIIREQKTVTTDGIEYFTVSPNSWGDYRLEVIDLQSNLMTEFEFSGEWSSSNSGQLPAVKPLHLNLTTQKPSFTPGDDIQLTINAPLDGNLTLLVEGREVLYQQNLDIVKGETKITIPFDKNWTGQNIYLSGLLLSKDKQQEVVRSLGIIPLLLDNHARKLQAELQFDPVAKPDQPVAIHIALNEDQYRNLTEEQRDNLYATVSITDVGILNMLPEKPISIFDAFFKQHRYSAEIIDYYNRLFKQGIGSLLNPQFGGDADLAEESAEIPNITEMKTVSLSSKLIKLKDGKATVIFDLPDFNGEGEVLVQLFNKEQVGSQAQPMTIRAPIVADLVTPRFVRVGDESYISLSVTNMSDQDDEVTIRLRSDQFVVEYENSTFLNKGEKFTKLIPIKLEKFVPFAEITMDIDAQSFSATRSYQIGTVTKTEKTTVYDRNNLSKGEIWQRNLKELNKYSDNYQEYLTLSRNPQINILSYTNGLFEYPYGCTEQTTSKAFPWLFPKNPILDQQKEYAYNSSMSHLPESKRSDFTQWEKKMMQETIQRLVDRQNRDGGFPLWQSGSSFAPSTNYVTDFLSQAQKQYPELIANTVLDNAYTYLKKSISDAQSVYNRCNFNDNCDYGQVLDRANIANVSYAAWILAREGKIFDADIHFLHNFSARLTPLASAYLSGASYLLGNESYGEIYANNIFASLNITHGYYGYYQTNVSSLALALGVFNSLTDRGYEISDKLKVSLFQLLNEWVSERSYFSTQDRYALIKLGLQLPDDQKPIDVIINGEKREIPANTPLPANMIATLKSAEPLFYEYQIEGYPKEQTDSINFKMDFYKSLLANQASTTFKVGERFVVIFEVRSVVDLPNALITDYIPAGFNLVNPYLNGENIDEFYENISIDYQYRRDIEHEEFRFDRYTVSLPMKADQIYRFGYILEAAVPGEYDMPATIIEDMYQPWYKNIIAKKRTLTIVNSSDNSR